MDLLDQMELIDISDQEALDVFFSSSGEEGGLASPLPGMFETWRYGFRLYTPALTVRSAAAQGHSKSEDVVRHGLFRHVLEGLEAKSRMSSTSSSSSSDSQTNGSDGDAPAARSAGEGTHTGTLKRRAAAAETEKARSQTPSTPS